MTAEPTSRPGRRANPRLRESILDAALELFAEQGYRATSVSQVVLRAGVTKGALYHYFEKKEDLLYEIYRDLLDVQLDDLDKIVAEHTDPAEALRALTEDLVVTTIGHLRAVAVFERDVDQLSPQRWETLQADWRRYQEVVRDLIRSAQRTGSFSTVASPELASWMIFGLAASLPNWYRPGGPKSPEEIAQETSGFVLAALHNPTAAPLDAPRL